MAFELKINQGTLFENDKNGVDGRPDYTGKINIGGEIKRIAAWVKKPEGKKLYLSLSISEFKNNGSNDSDLPF